MMPQNEFIAFADQKYNQQDNEKLMFSFKYLDWECEYFFLEGLKNEFYKKLFDTFNILTNTTIKEFREQICTLTSKSIFNTTDGLYKNFNEGTFDKLKLALYPREEWDEAKKEEFKNEVKKYAFEIRIGGGRSDGRIHGFLMNSCFYIVWFDPAHNLYFGKQKKAPSSIKEFATVKRCFSPENFAELQSQIDELQSQIDELTDLLDKETAPIESSVEANQKTT